MTDTEARALIDQAIGKNSESTALLNQSKSAMSDPVPPPPPPPTGMLPRYGGATGHVIQKDGSTHETINAELDKWKDIGCQLLRVDLLQSATYLARFHDIANGCAQRGIKVWACLRGTSGPYGAASAGAYAKAMASEFGTSLAGFGYVNEPNLGPNQVPRYAPELMGPELAAVYAAIKAVDNHILVGSCEMGWDSTGDYSSWWPKVYNSGGKDHFDIWIPHLYGMPNTAPWTEALATHAQTGQGKPILVTEAGTGQPAAQAQVIPAALKDTRVMSVCVYNMMPEVPGYNMFGNPGYNAYKSAPKP